MVKAVLIYGTKERSRIEAQTKRTITTTKSMLPPVIGENFDGRTGVIGSFLTNPLTPFPEFNGGLTLPEAIYGFSIDILGVESRIILRNGVLGRLNP